MSDTDIPLYAIAELLVRISTFHRGLGEYKKHTVLQKGIVITTTKGSLEMSKELVFQQVKSPLKVTDEELLLSAFSFRIS